MVFCIELQGKKLDVHDSDQSLKNLLTDLYAMTQYYNYIFQSYAMQLKSDINKTQILKYRVNNQETL